MFMDCSHVHQRGLCWLIGVEMGSWGGASFRETGFCSKAKCLLHQPLTGRRAELNSRLSGSAKYTTPSKIENECPGRAGDRGQQGSVHLGGVARGRGVPPSFPRILTSKITMLRSAPMSLRALVRLLSASPRLRVPKSPPRRSSPFEARCAPNARRSLLLATYRPSG